MDWHAEEVKENQWVIADTWADLGLHWHGYVERVQLAHAKSRDQRLRTEPDEVMANPDEVAAWLEGTIKAVTSPAPIKGTAVEDNRDFADSMQVWRALASQGETVATGVGAQFTVTAEAVTTQECDCQVSGPASVSRLSKGRRR